jgi:L-iditol 2-dehydrogenase
MTFVTLCEEEALVLLALVQETESKESIRLLEVEEPRCGPREVKIKVRAAGICGTDVYGIASLRPPVILGHEFSGEIVEIGDQVRHFKVGERVSSETTVVRCGECPYCREGLYNLCVNRKGIGSGVNGAFAEYIVVPEFTLYRLPEYLSFEEGALLEPLACAVRGVMEQAALKGTEKVLVFGPGPLGILVSWVANLSGAQVFLVGKAQDKERFAIALKQNIAGIIDIDEINIYQFVREKIDPYGVDVVFECSGSVHAVHQGLEVLRKRGKLVQMGILHREVELDFDTYFFSRELVVTGSRTQTSSSWQKAIALLHKHHLPLRELITHEFPLERWEKGFELVRRREALKVILKP